MIVVGTDDPSTSASTQLLIFGYIEETRYIFTCSHVNVNLAAMRAPLLDTLYMYMYIEFNDA